MKTAEAKTSATPARQNTPFFSRERGQSFFGKNADVDPFFTKQTTPFIQTKLTIGQPNDKYEQEADTMADQVVQRLSKPETVQTKPNPLANVVTPLIQAKCAACEEEEKLQKKEEDEDPLEDKVQRKPIFESNAPPPEDEIQRKCADCATEDKLQRKEANEHEAKASSSLESRLTTSKGSGNPLPETTRHQMETSFVADFSQVRIHTGSHAAQMSQDLHAHAFTHGSDIYFNSGKYQPESGEGQQLLAHELTHTIQQGHALTNVLQPYSWEEFTGDVSGVASSAGDVLSTAGSAVVETAVGVGQGISETVSSGVEAVGTLSESAIRATLDRFAPGLWDLITNGIGPTLKEKIFNNFIRVFQQLQEQIQSGEFVQKIRDAFAQSKEQLKEWQTSVQSSCDGFYEQIQAIVEFLGALVDPVIQEIKEELKFIAEFVGALWNSFGKPAWEAIREFAGEAWSWLQSTAQWIWDQTQPIRSSIASVWEWIKTQLGILQDNAASIWEQFKAIALSVWEEIKAIIRPVLGPLTAIGGILLMFSPLGPILLIYRAVPHVWAALKWIAQNWSGWQTLLQLKELFAETILPAIRDGVQLIRAKMEEAMNWVNGIISSLQAVVMQLLDSLGILEAIEWIQGVINQVQTFFNQIKAKFDEFIESLRTDVNTVIQAASNLLNVIWECVRPVLDFVLGIILLFINPYFWPVYAVALLSRLAWHFLPNGLKIAAIDWLINFLRDTIDYLQPSGVLAPVWQIFKSGAISFLNRIQEYEPDQKIRFVDKILNILIDPRTYGGYMRGLVAGFVLQAWDLISGVFSLLFGLPNIVGDIINFFRNLIPDLSFINRIRERMESIASQIQEWLNQENFIQEITNMILSAPQRLAEWMEETTARGAESAQQVGREFAERVVNFILSLDNANMGYMLGNITGRILFEVLLTKGIGFVIGRIAQGARWLRVALSSLRSRAQGAARAIFLRARQLFNTVMETIGNLFRRFGERMGRLFDDFKRLIDDFIRWIMRALRGSAENQIRWLAFTTEVSARTRGINSGYEGQTRLEAASMYRPILLRYNEVAGFPLEASLSINHRIVQNDENSGFWRLMARKKFGVLHPIERTLGTQVGRILMNKNRRWSRGREAIQERIAHGFSSSDMNKRALDDILDHYEEAYRYRRLEVEWDEAENDWNVMASMSPERIIGKISNPVTKGVKHNVQQAIIQKADTTDEEIAEISQQCTHIRIPPNIRRYGRMYRNHVVSPTLAREMTDQREIIGYQNETNYHGSNVAGFKYQIYRNSSLTDLVREDIEVSPNDELHSEQRIVGRLADIIDQERPSHVLFVDQIITERSPCSGCYSLIRNIPSSRILTQRSDVFFVTQYIRNRDVMARELRSAYCDF